MNPTTRLPSTLATTRLPSKLVGTFDVIGATLMSLMSHRARGAQAADESHGVKPLDGGAARDRRRLGAREAHRRLLC